MDLEQVERPADPPTEEDVRQALVVLRERYPHARVTAKIEGSVVRIQGSVPNPEDRREIARAFGEATGTRNLINAIRVD